MSLRRLSTACCALLLALLATGCAQPAAAVAAGPSCASPRPADRARCRRLEADVLASTVRLEVRVFVPDGQGGFRYTGDGGTSHATVVDGRYLLTHNHFRTPLSQFDGPGLRRLTVYDAKGRVLVDQASADVVDVAALAPQTLLLDFGDYGGQGLFAFLGLQSARLDAAVPNRLQPGVELAQVNWDGRAARVEWVRLAAVYEQDGTTLLELDSFVRPGASGGGVFFDGYYVGNNWLRITNLDAAGAPLRRFSVAAGDAPLLLDAIARSHNGTARAAAAGKTSPYGDEAGAPNGFKKGDTGAARSQ